MFLKFYHLYVKVMNLAKVCEDEDDEDLEFKVLKPKKTGRKVTNSAVTKKVLFVSISYDFQIRNCNIY